MFASLFSPRVVCDVCTKRFTQNLKETPLFEEGARVSFECPHCGTVYSVARITPRGLEVRAELQECTDPERRRALLKLMKAETIDERRTLA